MTAQEKSELSLNDFAGSIAVVVSSCDAFFDAWRPFAFFFQKCWPGCPLPVYLITNRLHVRSRTISALKTGWDHGWATNMLQALRRIEEPYIFYLQEDYFLTKPVEVTQLAQDFAYALKQQVDSFCFCDLSLLEKDFAKSNERVGLVPEVSKGRTRLQATLWKRAAFASLLKPGETAWEMESRGSERTKGMLMLSYARTDIAPIQYLMSGIVRGLWTTEAIALCQAHNFRITPRFRPTDATSLGSRKLRRAIGRLTFVAAYAKQMLRPVELDAAEERAVASG